MDYLKIAKDAKAKMEAMLNLAKTEKRNFTDAEKTAYDALQVEMNNALDMAERAAALIAAGNRITEPANDSIQRIEITDKRKGPFKNLVDQLSAVKNFAQSGNRDERLSAVNTILGMSEGSSKDGGFGVQSDFAGMLLDTAVKEDPILSLVDTYQVNAGSNKVEWVNVDEKDTETTVFGGVQVYWTAEGASTTASEPVLKEMELKLEKLMGLAYCTYELNADSSFVDQLYTRSFNLAIRKKLAEGIIGGTGTGQPLGILKSPALVSVDKETNQKAATITWANISAMFHRVMNKGQSVWLLHPDAHEQLDFLDFPVGVGGVPVYLPATQVGTIAALRGRPIIESENCSALGSLGDIMFIDPKQYIMIYKGGVQADVSIHVQFITAQNAFRFIFRANGMPKPSSDLKIKNSSKKRSVLGAALAARA